MVGVFSEKNMAASTEHECENDLFKRVYKRFKRRDRPLNVDGVINFQSSEIEEDSRVIPFKLSQPSSEKFPGLKPFKQWKAYQLKDCEGFVVISNPFERKYQRYWVERCLVDFPTKPNRTNLDAHMKRPSHIWQKCTTDDRPDLKKDSLLMKLRWATLGYQYEWNTKEYFADRVQSFPADLSHVCSYIAQTLGFSQYSSEAGIVNFYRMESTLMGHTDVSELDKAAPLISFSFGQSCIFLIGGPTKETEPIPVFLHSGDICLMTGKARLSYHAVPRILPGDNNNLLHSFYGDDDLGSRSNDNVNGENGLEHSNEGGTVSESTVNEENDPYDQKPAFMEINQSDNCVDSDKEMVIVTPTSRGNNCSVNELAGIMDSVIKEVPWESFQKYVNISRVNVNVRQVLKEGMELGRSPEVIKPCDKNCAK